MATSAPYQPFALFPRSVPKIAAPNPHNRAPSLQAIKSLAHVNIQEDPLPNGGSLQNFSKKHVAQQPEALVNDDGSRTSSLDCIGMAVTTMSPVDGSTPSPSVAHPPLNVATPPPPPPAPKPPASPSPEPYSGRSGSATLVQDPISATGITDPSPVVPMRSMFPTYNPSLPLQQQSYYPQRPYPVRMSSIARSNVSRNEYRSSLSIATPIDRAVGIRTAPASIINFPSDIMSINEPQSSSHRELEKLWEASLGSEPNRTIKSFALEMSRTEEAIFVFGADPQYPFYTLQTYDTAEIAVKKTNPRKRIETQDVVMSSIEPPARRLPPHDGLVAFLFPKMAAMLALTQSAALAKAHGLASTDKDDVEAAAVRRAAQQEACHLRWNAMKKVYELDHPAISRRSRDPNFVTSPATPQLRSNEKPVLHITISNSSMGAPISPSSPPTIFVTNPNRHVASPTSSAGPGLANGIRLSTLPQSDADSPLASLDLGSSMLNIDADQILSLMPSLFAIDAVVSAIMAVAIADQTTNPILGSMPVWRPRPKAPTSQFGGSVKSYAGSAFYATIAEREEAEEEAAVMKEEHDKDIKIGKKRKGKEYTGTRTWYGKKQKVKNRKKQVVMADFDLEKLGHYQAGKREGQELPAVTRGLVGGLVAILRFVVWLMTLIVQFVVWILVSGTRCVTSEKF